MTAKLRKLPTALAAVENFMSCVQSEKITKDEAEYQRQEDHQEYLDQVAADSENADHPLSNDED
jgi:hypothetical protein